MKIHLVAFASAAEVLGGRTRTLEIPDETSVSELLDQLEAESPGFSDLRGRLAVAVDGRLTRPDSTLRDGAEVALLPPVSGGKPTASQRLCHTPIDVEDVRREVADPSCGAQVVFLGCVRSDPNGPQVTHLTYDAYEPMAEDALTAICSEIVEGASGLRIAIVHRLGEVPTGEPSVVIATASPHRAAAYEANRDALERLKREVPIWKREHFADGTSGWREVEPLTRPTRQSP